MASSIKTAWLDGWLPSGPRPIAESDHGEMMNHPTHPTQRRQETRGHALADQLLSLSEEAQLPNVLLALLESNNYTLYHDCKCSGP